MYGTDEMRMFFTKYMKNVSLVIKFLELWKKLLGDKELLKLLNFWNSYPFSIKYEKNHTISQ